MPRPTASPSSTAPALGPVAYVLYKFPQLSQTFVRDEIWALREAGVRVDVISLEPADPNHPDETWAGPHQGVARPAPRRAAGDHLWWLRRHPRRYARFVRESLLARERVRYALLRIPTLARRLVASPPDLLHTHFAWDTATSVAALAQLLDRPASCTLHARDIYAQPAKTVRKRTDRLAGLVTVCEFNVGFMTGRGIVPAADPRLRVIPCAVGVPQPGGEPAADVVAVGRLVPKKGFDVLIRALVAVASAHPGLTVEIVGDGPERPELERLALTLGLGETVRFLGALPHAETLDRIGAGRVFCLPARAAADGDSDAMPVVIREAMARAVPVVTSRIAGIPESVDDTVGWLTDPGDVDGLAGALLAGLGDEVDRRRRGDAARQRVIDRWTPERQAAALVERFTELVRVHA